MTDKMTAEQAILHIKLGYKFTDPIVGTITEAFAVLEALTAPRVPEGWRATHNQLPDHSVPVIGFNPDWIDEDFNAHGVRECFVTGDGTEWVSAQWFDEQDCYETVTGKAPTHWMPYPIVGDVTAAPAPADDKLAAAEARVRELEESLRDFIIAESVEWTGDSRIPIWRAMRNLADRLRVDVSFSDQHKAARLRGGSDE